MNLPKENGNYFRSFRAQPGELEAVGGGSSCEIERSLQRVVRRALRRDRASSQLDRQIISLADEVPQPAEIDAAVGRERLVAHVSRQLCELLLAAQRPWISLRRQVRHDTLRLAQTQRVV